MSPKIEEQSEETAEKEAVKDSVGVEDGPVSREDTRPEPGDYC